MKRVIFFFSFVLVNISSMVSWVSVSGAVTLLDRDVFIMSTDGADKIASNLEETFPDLKKYFKIESKNEQFLEVYFESPEMFFLETNGALVYRARELKNKKKNKKTFSEYVELIFNNRELKRYAVKHYNTVASIEGKHPLMSLVNRDQRKDFLVTLEEGGIDNPMLIRPIFQVSKNVLEYKFSENERDFLSIFIEKLHSRTFGGVRDFALVSVYFNESLVSELDEVRGNKLKSVFLLFDNIKNKRSGYDRIKSEYALIYSKMTEGLFFSSFMFKHQTITRLVFAIMYGVLGLFLLLLFFRERMIPFWSNRSN